MAQYMISVFHEPGVQDAGTAYQDDAALQAAFAAVAEFNSGLQAAGQFVYACGLMPPESSYAVDATAATPFVYAGPFSVSAASIGGFWIVEALDESVALDLATRASAACGQKVEVRPLQAG
ncbi:YciI family protein [Kocuria atrinae]|uniref:YciI family protein n=1 Tax=Kocuria atrinae TaxID=592377 RepID=A0ABN2XQR6_9MICC